MATTKRISSHGLRPQGGHQGQEQRQGCHETEGQASQVSLPVSKVVCLLLVSAIALCGCRTSSPSPPVYSEHTAANIPQQTPPQNTHLQNTQQPASTAQAPGQAPSSFQTVSFEEDAQPPAEELPGLPALQDVPLEDLQPAALSVEDVLTAVQASYPLLASAYLGRDVAAGQTTSAWGNFDLNLKAHSVSFPEGFYERYRNKVSLEQPLFNGGYLYGGYRIGEGDFPVWYGENETNGGGEFAAAVGMPLLKGRAIDKRRAELFKAQLERERVEPEIRAQLIDFTRVATIYYWDWVAAGQARNAQRGLLSLAQERVQNIKRRIELGDLKSITRINNEQLIASRETKLIESERKLQSAAIKLSLFFRDASGQPLIPHESVLPGGFPVQELPSKADLADATDAAIAASPMLAEMDFQIRQTRVDLQEAQNSLLPKLDAQLYASKDVGDPTSAKGDKTPFELELGLYGEVPLQRRQAFGKVTSTQAKLAQLSVKREFTADKTVAAVQDAISAILNAHERIRRAEQNVRLADEALTLARIQFNEGDIDLVELNIYEQATTDARLIEISAKADFFKALADYRAALSILP